MDPSMNSFPALLPLFLPNPLPPFFRHVGRRVEFHVQFISLYSGLPPSVDPLFGFVLRASVALARSFPKMARVDIIVYRGRLKGFGQVW